MKKNAYTNTLLYKQWRSIKEKYNNIIFFQVGDFYELFEEDAEVVSPILGLTLTRKNKKKNFRV